jgi:hypothetical protein
MKAPLAALCRGATRNFYFDCHYEFAELRCFIQTMRRRETLPQKPFQPELTVLILSTHRG